MLLLVARPRGVLVQVQHGVLAATVTAADELLGKSVNRMWADRCEAGGAPGPLPPPVPPPPRHPVGHQGGSYAAADAVHPTAAREDLPPARADDVGKPVTGSGKWHVNGEARKEAEGVNGAAAASQQPAVAAAGVATAAVGSATAAGGLKGSAREANDVFSASCHSLCTASTTQVRLCRRARQLFKCKPALIKHASFRTPTTTTCPVAVCNTSAMQGDSGAARKDAGTPAPPAAHPSTEDTRTCSTHSPLKRGRDMLASPAAAVRGPGMHPPPAWNHRNLPPATGAAAHASALPARLPPMHAPQSPHHGLGARAIHPQHPEAAAAASARMHDRHRRAGGSRSWPAGVPSGEADTGDEGRGSSAAGERAGRGSAVAMALPPGDLSEVLKGQLVSLASFQNRPGHGRGWALLQPLGPDAVDADGGGAAVAESRCAPPSPTLGFKLCHMSILPAPSAHAMAAAPVCLGITKPRRQCLMRTAACSGAALVEPEALVTICDHFACSAEPWPGFNVQAIDWLQISCTVRHTLMQGRGEQVVGSTG